MIAKTRSTACTELEPELTEALGNFKSSVDAWSAVRSDTCGVSVPDVSQGGAWSWRLALGGVCGCLLVAGSLTVALVRSGHHTEPGRASVSVAGAALVQQRPLPTATAVSAGDVQFARAERELAAVEELLAREDRKDRLAGVDSSSDDDLMAAIGTDLARQVPAAMEPLALLATAGDSE